MNKPTTVPFPSEMTSNVIRHLAFKQLEGEGPGKFLRGEVVETWEVWWFSSLIREETKPLFWVAIVFRGVLGYEKP